MKSQNPAFAKVKRARMDCLVVILTALTLSGCSTAKARSAGPTGEAGTDARNLETFGTAGKAEKLYPNREVVLFDHKGAGCLTHMWFGGDWPGYGRTRIRVYVDGEAKPSIDMELFLGHGIGWDDPAAPWGTARMGKTGQPSGLYNSYRIPFGESVRVTGELGAGVERPQTFWWIVRGVRNLPVYLGNIRLPSNARLRLQVRKNINLKPLQMVDLAQSPGAGALYQVTLAVASKKCDFLEGMMRAYVNGANEPLLLSSGTEDYFLGTYYFNRGMYHLPLAGLTHKEVEPSGACQFSAYRFHVEDPLIFQKGWRLVWRNGEEKAGKPYGSPQPSQMTSYVWVYEW
jgi:D-arabinan exo alpha-(1,3)/(1,5)-arabinofuranosidase (non-reducing end)